MLHNLCLSFQFHKNFVLFLNNFVFLSIGKGKGGRLGQRLLWSSSFSGFLFLSLVGASIRSNEVSVLGMAMGWVKTGAMPPGRPPVPSLSPRKKKEKENPLAIGSFDPSWVQVVGALDLPSYILYRLFCNNYSIRVLGHKIIGLSPTLYMLNKFFFKIKKYHQCKTDRVGFGITINKLVMDRVGFRRGICQSGQLWIGLIPNLTWPVAIPY